ncbi:MAG: XisI protein [Bacteroidota bacterium]
MEKLSHYQNLIIRLLEDYILVKPANIDEHEYQVIADTQRNHFQVVSMGWHKKRFFHHVILHLDIKPDGKIWLQVNNTDWNIVDDLLEDGVPKTEIVLGSLSPEARAHSGYAVM